MAPNVNDHRNAVTKAIDELQRIKVGGNPQTLGEDAVNIQRIQALLTGVSALALIDIGENLKALTGVVASNG
jgi:hypothetical protein